MDKILFCRSCGAFREPRSTDATHAECRQCHAKVTLRALSTQVKGVTTTLQIPRSVLLLRLYGRHTSSDAPQEAVIEEECPRCKHPRLSFRTAQLRGVDEGQTIFYTCLNPACGHKFTVNS